MNEGDFNDYGVKISKSNRRRRQEVKLHQVVMEHSRGLKGIWRMIIEKSKSFKKKPHV